MTTSADVLRLVLGGPEPRAIDLEVEDPTSEFPGLVAAGALVDGELRLEWPWVLALLDSTEAEERRRAELVEVLPAGVTEAEAELLRDLFEALQIPGVSSGIILKPKVRGLSGNPGFTVVPHWSGAGPRTVVRREGGLLRLPDGGVARATLSQFQVLERLEEGYTGSGDKAADKRFMAEIASLVPRDDPGVELEHQFRIVPFRSVRSVAPRLERARGRYVVLPRARGVDDQALVQHYVGTPLGQLGDARPEVVNPETGQNEQLVFQESAKRGLRKLRARPVLEDEEVAEALTNPDAFFGPDVDTSSFSERVTGLGPPIRRVLPTIRELKGDGWWDWDIEAEGYDLDEDAETDGGPVGADFDLKDEAVLEKLEASLAKATESKRGYIPHPTREGTFIPVDAHLRQAVSAARKLHEETEKSGGRLSKPVREVLHVRENVESLTFARTEDEEALRVSELPPPPDLKPEFELKPHQVEGYSWLAHLFGGAGGGERWRGALLADDMGLGKTLQVLSFLNWARANGFPGPHLVVAPVALLENWQQEAARFFGAALEPIMQVSGKVLPEEPDHAAARLQSQNLVLVSYETLRRRELQFAAVDFGLVVLDEAQKAKEPASNISRVVRVLKARARLAMTGTPVENSLKELWNLVDWALPGRMGTLRQFVDEYMKPLRESFDSSRAHELAERLQARIQPVFLRRMKSEVLAGLPDLIPERMEVSLSPLQVERYTRIVKSEHAAMTKLQGLLGVCAHPDLTSSRARLGPLDDDPFPKALKLMRILEGVRAAGEKAIVFANRRSAQQWIAEEVRARFGVQVEVINGLTNESRARMAMIRRFEGTAGFAVLVLSPRAAGVGLNIVEANHVIHYMREWNPAVENQATDRAYRMGQKRPVRVYTIVATKEGATTVDERLDALLEKKRALMSKFVVPMGAMGVTPKELGDDEGLE